MEKQYDVVIIGGGPSGMAAALSALKHCKKVLLLERDNKLGGILNQCIHNGFGLKIFGEELTGPEYAYKLAEKIKNENIDTVVNAFVTKIHDKKISFICQQGAFEIETKAVVLATGCRERTASEITLCGDRVAGIYTAGLVQKMINHYGKVPGKKAVILGSGDIGLIMARRLTFSGVKVETVLEIMPNSSGLKRNIQQCLNDFNIPLLFSHTVTRTVGKDRLEGVYIAPVNENLKPDLTKEKFIECDTLLLSVGLIPENILINKMIEIDNKTKSAVVDENRQTSTDYIFTSGNVLHIHDLADNATIEGEIAGNGAGLFASNKIEKSEKLDINFDQNISYCIPQKFNKNSKKFKIFFRVKNKKIKTKIIAKSGDKIIGSKYFMAINPGEMCEFEVENAGENINLLLENK